jgi:hypothetical protein
MLSMIRKVSGFLAVCWLGLVGGTVIAFLLAVAFGGTQAFQPFILLTAGMGGITIISWVVGVGACIVWFGVSTVERRRQPSVVTSVGFVPVLARNQPPKGTNFVALPNPEETSQRRQSAGIDGAHEVYTYSAPGQPLCPECEARPTIFYCIPHRLGLCLQCVGRHDRPDQCTYAPAFRVPNRSREDAGEQKTPGPQRGPKPGDIFGIT